MVTLNVYYSLAILTNQKCKLFKIIISIKNKSLICEEK